MLQKKTREMHKNLSEEEKEKKWHFGHEWHRNLPELEK